MTSLSIPFSETPNSSPPRKACADLVWGTGVRLSSETKCLLCGRLKAVGIVITAGTALFFVRALLIGDTTLLAFHLLVLVLLAALTGYLFTGRELSLPIARWIGVLTFGCPPSCWPEILHRLTGCGSGGEHGHHGGGHEHHRLRSFRPDGGLRDIYPQRLGPSFITGHPPGDDSHSRKSSFALPPSRADRSDPKGDHL